MQQADLMNNDLNTVLNVFIDLVVGVTRLFLFKLSKKLIIKPQSMRPYLQVFRELTKRACIMVRSKLSLYIQL